MRAVLLFALLASCDYAVTGYDRQPVETRGPTFDRVIIYPHWVKDVDEIVRGGHCTVEPGQTDVGCADVADLGPGNVKCDLYAQQPKDFNDAARLAVLGHEAFHCFGAKHA